MTICKLKELFLFCLNQTALPDMQIKGEKEQLCGIFFVVSEFVCIFDADFVRTRYVQIRSRSYHRSFLYLIILIF